jgi:hypothetical protein
MKTAFWKIKFEIKSLTAPARKAVPDQLSASSADICAPAASVWSSAPAGSGTRKPRTIYYSAELVEAQRPLPSVHTKPLPRFKSTAPIDVRGFSSFAVRVKLPYKAPCSATSTRRAKQG